MRNVWVMYLRDLGVGRERVQPVDIPSVLASFKPRSFVLSEIAQEYLTLRDIDQKPPTVAMSGFISLAGDRDVFC